MITCAVGELSLVNEMVLAAPRVSIPADSATANCKAAPVVAFPEAPSLNETNPAGLFERNVPLIVAVAPDCISMNMEEVPWLYKVQPAATVSEVATFGCAPVPSCSVLEEPSTNNFAKLGAVESVKLACRCTSELACSVPKVGKAVWATTMLFTPELAAVASMVPVMPAPDAMVRVTPADAASPNTILEPEPEIVHGASVVALFSIL